MTQFFFLWKMAGLDAGRNGIISVMEKGAQWVPLVSPGSPLWCTSRLQISTAKASHVCNWYEQELTQSPKWCLVVFFLVLNKPWIKAAFTVTLLILSNRWYHRTQKLYLFFFSQASCNSMIHTVTVSLETLVWCISSQSRRLLSYVNTAEAVIVTGWVLSV